jgi:F-type H+-transporting ATPase subunit a
VPQGTPPSLISFIVLIERVRRIIRPFTLAVRLAANIIAGHLLLTLLGGSARIFRFSRRIIVVNSQVLLVVLEVAVAAIQSYVFVILRSLYLRET